MGSHAKPRRALASPERAAKTSGVRSPRPSSQKRTRRSASPPRATAAHPIREGRAPSRPKPTELQRRTRRGASRFSETPRLPATEAISHCRSGRDGARPHASQPLSFSASLLARSAPRLLDRDHHAALAFQHGGAVADTAGDRAEDAELVLHQLAALHRVHDERTFEQPRLRGVG